MLISLLISDISSSFHEFEFNEAQEQFLISRIEQTVESQSSGDNRFKEITASIAKLEKLIEVNEPVQMPELESTDDVELF